MARQAEQPHRLVESSTGTPVRLLASRGKAWRATVAGRYDDRLKPVPSAACAVPRMYCLLFGRYLAPRAFAFCGTIDYSA